MGIDILGIDIMGVDILGIYIVALPHANHPKPLQTTANHSESDSTSIGKELDIYI